jgi:hypothetical protein
MLTGSAADGVYRVSLMDELRRIELAPRPLPLCASIFSQQKRRVV